MATAVGEKWTELQSEWTERLVDVGYQLHQLEEHISLHLAGYTDDPETARDANTAYGASGRYANQAHADVQNRVLRPPHDQYGSKRHGHALRLIGVVHVAEHMDAGAQMPREISLETVERGITLPEYLLEARKRLTHTLGADPAEAAAWRIVNRLIAAVEDPQQAGTITASEIGDGLKMTKADAAAALEVAVARGWVWPMPPAPKKYAGKGGRPPERYAVNPTIAEVIPGS